MRRTSKNGTVCCGSSELCDTGAFFTRNFAGLGQRAGADRGKEWVSSSCKPYVAKSQSGIERIRLNLSCSYFRRCKIVGVFGDLANFIEGAGCNAGAALHDGMEYQARKVRHWW